MFQEKKSTHFEERKNLVESLSQKEFLERSDVTINKEKKHKKKVERKRLRLSLDLFFSFSEAPFLLAKEIHS